MYIIATTLMWEDGNLTTVSTYSLGRRILKADPFRDLPSKERAAVASSGVRNSTNA